MILTRLTARTLPLLMSAAVLLLILTSPAATLLQRLGPYSRSVRDDEDGEIVQSILWVAGFAAIAIAVVAIIRAFVLSEAENLPTSGNAGG
jgi:hypothetical protein